MRPAAATAEKTDADGLPIENVPGRSKKRPRQTFDADWREPKLITIFVHNEHGRMEKESRASGGRDIFRGRTQSPKLVRHAPAPLGGCTGGEYHVWKR